MSRRTAEELIGELAGAVGPVRRIPRLRHVAAGSLLAFAAASAGMLLAGGAPGDFLVGAPFGDRNFALVLAGLCLLPAAALAALASVVPGRGAAVRAAAAAAAVGLALALAGGIAAALQAPPDLAADLATSAGCIVKAAALALAPLAIAAVFLSRGVLRRPLLTAGLGVVGAAALGGALIHVGCRVDGALHPLVGHALAPLLLGAALAFPVGWLISRRPAPDRP